jgi:hypothetical protein
MIKKFNDFQINESFSQSKEYNDLLNSKSKSKGFFLDNLEEVSDLSNAKVSYYNYIVDSKGHMVNVDIDEKENYVIKYVIVIDYKMQKEYPTDNFFKVIDDLNIIKVSIEEMIDRCKGELKLSLNKVLNDVNTLRQNNDNKLSFVIHFDSDINSKDLYNTYKDWEKFEDSEYKVGMEELDNIYYGEGIDLSKFIDTQDVGDYKDIGFITDDGEIYIIAHYHRSKKVFTIDRDEVRESINWYNSTYDDGEFLNF